MTYETIVLRPEFSPQNPQGAPEIVPRQQQPDAPNGQTQDPGGTTTPKPQQACGTDTMLMMVVFFAIMYFLLIRPANKQRKEHAAMLTALRKGDRIVTSGGIHGVVASLDEKVAVLRIDDIQMTVDRSAIARVVRDEPATKTGE